MIIKTFDDIRNTKGDITGNGWSVIRLLHAEDNFGITISDCIIEGDLDVEICYVDKDEANYILEGEGTLEDLKTGKIHDLKPGTFYGVKKNERHRIKTTSRMRAISVFNPPF